MSFWGKLFGSDKALEGVISGVTNGLDALVYTDEEKAGDAAKERTEGRMMVIEWMKATAGQNLSRRLIALSITGVWLSMKLASVLCGMVAVFTNDYGVVTAAKVNAVGVIASDASSDMNAAVMLILAFYFAAPHMGDIAKAVTRKFSKDIK